MNTSGWALSQALLSPSLPLTMWGASGGAGLVITVVQTAQQLRNSRNVLPGFSNSTETFTKTPYFEHLVSKGSFTNGKRARLRHKASAQQLLKILKWWSTASPQYCLTDRPPKHILYLLLPASAWERSTRLSRVFYLFLVEEENKLGEPGYFYARMTRDWNTFIWTCFGIILTILVFFFRHPEPRTQTFTHQHNPALIKKCSSSYCRNLTNC